MVEWGLMCVAFALDAKLSAVSIRSHYGQIISLVMTFSFCFPSGTLGIP